MDKKNVLSFIKYTYIKNVQMRNMLLNGEAKIWDLLFKLWVRVIFFVTT